MVTNSPYCLYNLQKVPTRSAKQKNSVVLLLSILLITISIIVSCASSPPQLDLSTLENKEFFLREVNAIIPYIGDAIESSEYEKVVGQEVFERIVMELFLNGNLETDLLADFGIRLNVEEFTSTENQGKIKINTSLRGVDNEEIISKKAHMIFEWKNKSIATDHVVDIGTWNTKYFSPQSLDFSYTIIPVDRIITITGKIIVENPNPAGKPLETPFSYKYSLQEKDLLPSQE